MKHLLATCAGLALLSTVSTAQQPVLPDQLTNSILSLSDAQFVDIDGDGDLDLLYGSAEFVPIAWLENIGGQLDLPQNAHPISSPANGVCSIVKVADLDVDGKIDIVAAFIGKIYWIRGLGGGKFDREVMIGHDFGDLIDIEILDYNGDGLLDVISSWDSLFGDFIGWNECLPGGVFGPLTDTLLPVVPFGPKSMDAGDFDGDGDLDLLVAKTFGIGAVWIETVSGPGGGAIHMFADGVYTEEVAAADYDNDGDVDVIIGSGSKIHVLENLGAAVFGPPQVLSSIADINSVGAADLDGDGDLEILGSSGDSINSIQGEFFWYETLGSSTFGPKQTLQSNSLAGLKLMAGDYDGDGDQDLVSLALNADDSPNLSTHEHLGLGVFGPEFELTDQTPGFQNVAVGDVDNDGDIDVLSASRTDNKISLFSNLGGGDYAKQVVLKTTPKYLKQVTLAYLDGDQFVDILFLSSPSKSTYQGKAGKIGWFRGLGGGHLLFFEIYVTGRGGPTGCGDHRC